jgi:hypothetical protein
MTFGAGNLFPPEGIVMKSGLKCTAIVAVMFGCASVARAQTATFVQVNVNSLGQDIVGDAANEPSIAVDPTNPNCMAIGWRQFNTITNSFRQAGVAYTTNGGQTWTASVLQPGQFRSDPVLRADADGNFYYASLNSITAVNVFKSTNGGASWSFPVYAFGGDKEWIAIDTTNGPGRGNIYHNWNVQFSTVPDASFTRSTNGGASFEEPTTGPFPYSRGGQLAVGPNGTVYSGGSTLDQTAHVFAKSTNAQFAAQTPTFTSQIVNLGGTESLGTPFLNPVGLLGQTSMQAAANGNLYMLQSVDPPGPDPLDVMFIRSTDDGETWSTPVRVNNNLAGDNSYQWFGTMSVAPNGRIDAIWNDTSVNPHNTFSVLKYAYSLDDGLTWLGNIALTPQFDHTLGYPSQQKIGDYYDMVSDDTGASLAFAATFSGGQDVYYMRITAAVPEPAMVGLMFAGAAIACPRRRAPRSHR